MASDALSYSISNIIELRSNVCCKQPNVFRKWSINHTDKRKGRKDILLVINVPPGSLFSPLLLLPYCLVTYSGEMKIDEASHNF